MTPVRSHKIRGQPVGSAAELVIESRRVGRFSVLQPTRRLVPYAFAGPQTSEEEAQRPLIDASPQTGPNQFRRCGLGRSDREHLPPSRGPDVFQAARTVKGYRGNRNGSNDLFVWAVSRC